VIYVVDSADDTQTLVSKLEFHNILIHNDLKDAVILILANKKDLPSSKSAGEISESFNLHEIKNHDWHI
jgi:signal recognition particle receptor subunit beta